MDYYSSFFTRCQHVVLVLAVASGVLPFATLEHPAHRLPISPSGHVEDGHFRGLDPKDWHRVTSLPATTTV